MSPRCLLYCSNRETSQLFATFLRELHFEVEYCAEIFGAVKRLTSHSHEVIIVDWDEGPEAAFLLKTARELQSNRDAFVIAMAKSASVAAAREAGANEVVTKPPASEIKSGLVSSRDFLAGLERRLETPRVASAPAVVAPVRVASSFAPPAPAAPPKPKQVLVPKPVYQANPATLTFASFDGGFFSGSALRRIASFGRHEFATLLKVNRQRNALLRLAAMVIAFFTVGYVASQPLSRVGDSMAEMYQEAWGISAPVHHSARAELREAPQLAQAMVPEAGEPRSASESSTSESSSPERVRVTPLYHDPQRREKSPSGPRAPADPVLNPDAQTVMAETETGLRIPESLTGQFTGGATVRSVAEKIKPAILGALEPVNLPGYLADKLLVDKVDPSYPEKALQAGLHGPVVLQAWIGRDGTIRDLKLIRGPLLLGQAAYKAVKQWRYQPYLLNGEAVEAQTYVTVDFKHP